MARIPQSELEKLKRDVDLAGLIIASGVKLEKQGGNFVGLCPMHDDKDPSLVVTPSKNLWNCLGACGAGGTVVDWVMKTQGVNFRHAVEILRKSSSIGPPIKAKCRTVPKLPCPLSEDASNAKLLAEIVDYYHQALLESPEAIEYLEKRGINDPEAIKIFRLGFVNRTLGLRIPDSNRAAGKAIRQRLAEAGIIRSSGHEHFNGSVVFPVFDVNDAVVEMYGRKITPNLRKGTPNHLYLPGPHRGIFNFDALRKSKEIILCESLIDALTFWCAGYHNVTSSFGTNGFTDEIFESLMACGVKRVLIAYDRDDAGENSACKLADRLGKEGLSCFRIHFPHNMDVNEYALKVKPASQSLGVLMRAAKYMSGPLKALSIEEPCAEPCAEPSAEKPINKRQMDVPKPVSSLAAGRSLPNGAETQQVAGSSGPASPMQPAPAGKVKAEISGHEVIIVLGDRRWRIRGLARNLSYEHMKINLLAACGEHFHVDALDLYSARQRGLFLKQAAEELQVKSEILKKDLGKVLLKLEELQDQQIKKQLEPKDAAVHLSEDERKAALKLLKDKRLLDRITADLGTCGLVGEYTNKLVAYIAAVSRKLSKPLAVMVQSSSASGKSALMDAVLTFCPEEERVQYSAMTGQSLFYMGESDLKHKILAIAEEEGAEKASYALKLLQSEGKLSIASTGKDPKSGRLITHEYSVEGPAAILLTTTAIDLDEELLNRCIVLAVDESREQTRAIHQMQREDRTLEGLERRLARTDLRKLHKNAQRLLRPLHVVNPYADRLTFLDDTTRTRRDHLKYLGLIDAVALIHQYQREIKTGVVRGRRIDYIEATLSDIAMANQLACEALGRTLDELPPQTRKLLEMVHGMVAECCEAQQIDQQDFFFSRRDVLDATGWSYPQVRKHLARLMDLEYLLVHRGRRGHSFVYEMLWDGEGSQGECFVMGLIDPEKLKESAGTIQALTPSEQGFDPPLTPHLPPFDPSLTPGNNGGKSLVSITYDQNTKETPENALIPPQKKSSSYPTSNRSAVMLSAAARGE